MPLYVYADGVQAIKAQVYEIMKGNLADLSKAMVSHRARAPSGRLGSTVSPREEVESDTTTSSSRYMAGLYLSDK